MEETLNTQEYIHRLKFCCRVVKLFELGEVHVFTPHFKPIYQIIKNGIPSYTFHSLTKFENFVERCCARRTALSVSDNIISRRMNTRREQKLARANGRRTYSLRSAV